MSLVNECKQEKRRQREVRSGAIFKGESYSGGVIKLAVKSFLDCSAIARMLHQSHA